MRIKPAVGAIIGPVSDTQWGQTLTLPTAYGVVEVESAGNARDIGVSVLSAISDGLSSPVVSLAQVEAVARSAKKNDVVTILLVVAVGEVLYIVLLGEGAVFLKRDTRFARLVSRQDSISGEAKASDTLLLTSRSFTSVFTDRELAESFDHLPAEEVAEKLTLMLHEKTGGEGAAALVIQVTGLEEQEPVEQEEDTEEPPPVRQKLAAHTRTLVTGVLRRIPAGFRIKKKLTAVRADPAQLKKILVIGVIGLFVISVVLGVIRQIGRAQNQTAVATISEAQHAFDEGVALLELNPVKGRERLLAAKILLEPLRQTVPARSSEGLRIDSLYTQISDYLTQAMQVVETPLALFYDMGLIKKGAIASAFAISEQMVGIADSVAKTIYSLDLSTKNGEVVAGGDTYQGLSQIAAHVDKLYALADDGVLEARTTDSKTTAVIKKDDAWGTIGALVSYGGNLYLLDSAKSRIWKYVAVDKSPVTGLPGFSERREYLNPDTLPDLSRATSMAIDGSVWVATHDGHILRFTQGQENTFVPKGIEPPLGDNLMVFTNDAVKNIYLLDRSNKRVVVLDKEGLYLSQYVWREDVRVDQLVVSEEQKKILLLVEGKIYALELK